MGGNLHVSSGVCVRFFVYLDYVVMCVFIFELSALVFMLSLNKSLNSLYLQSRDWAAVIVPFMYITLMFDHQYLGYYTEIKTYQRNNKCKNNTFCFIWISLLNSHNMLSVYSPTLCSL